MEILLAMLRQYKQELTLGPQNDSKNQSVKYVTVNEPLRGVINLTQKNQQNNNSLKNSLINQSLQ